MAATPQQHVGAGLILYASKLVDLAQRAASDWASFRAQVLAALTPRVAVGAFPSKMTAADTVPHNILPENPGRNNAIFYNDPGAGAGVRAYLVFGYDGNTSKGFTWALPPGTGITLEQICPGFKGPVWVTFAAIDTGTVLGITEGIG